MGIVFDVLLVLVTAIVGAVFLFPVRCRVNRVKFIAQALSFPVVLVWLALVAALVATLVWGVTGAEVWGVEVLICLLYAAGGTVQVFRLGLTNAAPTVAADGLTIMGWNTLGDSVPVEYLRDVILAHRPTAVGLPEMSAEHVAALVEALTASGYVMTGYNVGPKDGHLPHETGLLIHADFGAYTVQRLNVLGASTLEATPVDATKPTFVAVHTVAPTFAWHESWRQDLAMLTARYRGSKKTILVGDFNATVTHMRTAGTAGVLGDLIDVAQTVGAGALGTWAVGKPVLLGTQIDHVLVSPDLAPDSFHVFTSHDAAGSDHRAILARVKTGE